MKGYIINYPPHITKDHTTNTLMLDVLIALIPLLCVAVYVYTVKILLLFLVSIVAAVACEFLCNLVFEHKFKLTDISSVVTGVIVAMLLPPAVPIYYPAIASAFGIIFIKMAFGGIGKNFVNVAGAGILILFLIFETQILNSFLLPYECSAVVNPADFVESGNYIFSVLKGFIGGNPGLICETSALAVVAGGLYLLIKGVADYKIPCISIAVFVIMIILLKGPNAILPYLFSGGFIFIAFFMATEYVTSPNSLIGVAVYSIIFGVLASLLMVYASVNLGALYGLLVANLTTPTLDRLIVPRFYGQNVDLK